MPDDRHFFEIQKKILLKNAIASSPPLRDVKDQANQHLTRSRQDLNYDQCSNLILSAATNQSMQFSPSGSQISRNVYVTESNNSDISRDSISDFTEDNINYDIDASSSTLLINVSNQSPNNNMPKEDFSTLSPEVRQIWCKIPNDIKVVTLRSRTVNSNDGVNNHSKNAY